jgi:ketosteroid isomerase-like protein
MDPEGQRISELGGDRPRVRSLQSLHVKVQGHHRRIAMADSPNVAVVRRLYQARGNPDVIRQVLGREVRWEVVDGFPYGAVYEGLDSVLHDFFGRLFTDFDEFVANGSEFFESSDHVIALGSYSGRARRSGKRFTARFAHVWTLRDGSIVRLQQCADTVQLARALAD